MKIIYYSAHPNLTLSANTGYGTHMREVIKGFKNEGHEVKTLIIGGEKENYLYKSNNIKNKIKQFIPNIIWETFKDFNLLKTDKASLKELDYLIKEFKPDLIYERGYYLLKSGLLASLKYNIPHIIELNAPYVEERVKFSGKSLLLSKAKKSERFQLIHATSIVVVSSALKKHFNKIVPNINHKILVTPNAINPNEIKLSTEQQKFIQNKFNLTGKITIGFVGSIFPYHGVEMLIKAFALLKNNNNDYKLLIVGDGYMIEELKFLAKNLKIEANTIFTGKVNHQDVFDYINLMDITIMPQSNWYGSPVKIFEYGYLKKAVIAPNYAPLRDVLIHDKNGIMIAPSIINLKIELERLISNKKLREELGNELYKDIIKTHTWDKVVNSILKFKPEN